MTFLAQSSAQNCGSENLPAQKNKLLEGLLYTLMLMSLSNYLCLNIFTAIISFCILVLSDMEGNILWEMLGLHFNINWKI